MFLKELTSFLAALLFAVHPIHTEAVSFKIFEIVLFNQSEISVTFFICSYEKNNKSKTMIFKYLTYLHRCLRVISMKRKLS